MDINGIGRNMDRKVLSEYNMDESKTERTQENLRYLGFPNRNKLLHTQREQNANLSFFENLKNKRKRNLEAQKENMNIQGTGIKTSSAMETLVLKKKEDRFYACEPTSEGKAFKRRMLQMPENHSSPDIQERDLVKADPVMKRAQDKNKVSTGQNTHLPPGLTDLVLKPNKDKICRPPNAYMLFAKEHRSSESVGDPKMTNGQRSHLLGSMWRSLSDAEKEKYYWDANALQKLHKETYPNYIYSPREARKQKQIRREKRLQLKKGFPNHQPKKPTKTSRISDDRRGKCLRNKKSQKNEPKAAKNDSFEAENADAYSPSVAKIPEEIGSEDSQTKKAIILRLSNSSVASDGCRGESLTNNTPPQAMESKVAQRSNCRDIKRENSCKMPGHPLSAISENWSNDPFQSPLYYSRSREQRMAMAEYSAPCHYCPIHGFNRRYIEHNHSNLTPNEHFPTPSNSHESFPAIQNPFFQPFHPLFNNNFHPAVWNPWMMWPGSNYNPVTGADFHEDWMKFGPPEHLKKQDPRRQDEKKVLSTATSDDPATVPTDTFSTLLKDQPSNVLSDQYSSVLGDQPFNVLRNQSSNELRDQFSTVLRDQPLSVLKDQPPSNLRDHSFSVLKDQPSNILGDQRPSKNEVKSSSALAESSTEGGSEENEFRPLFIDEVAEDESFCDAYKK